MRSDKEKAFELRRNGFSYKEIARQLNIPMSTLSYWFRREPWSREITARLSMAVSLKNPEVLKRIAQANYLRWEGRRTEYRDLAIQEFESLKKHSLFLSGVMLYWGRGDKRTSSSVVRFSGSEPEMVRIFYLFLTKVLGIDRDKIHATLYLYPDLIERVQQNFWTRASGIPATQFKKAAYLKRAPTTKRSAFGVCTVVINSRSLKERLLVWIELYQELLRTEAQMLEKIR